MKVVLAWRRLSFSSPECRIPFEHIYSLQIICITYTSIDVVIIYYPYMLLFIFVVVIKMWGQGFERPHNEAHHCHIWRLYIQFYRGSIIVLLQLQPVPLLCLTYHRSEGRCLWEITCCSDHCTVYFLFFFFNEEEFVLVLINVWQLSEINIKLNSGGVLGFKIRKHLSICSVKSRLFCLCRKSFYSLKGKGNLAWRFGRD